jgi:hypothetical protein
MTMVAHKKSITMKFQLWTYDVWGNAKDGYEVNDRYKSSEVIEIQVKATVHNAGTPHEFIAYHPTDRQLSRAVGCKGLEWDGESDYTLYATRARDGKPMCELERIKDGE